MGMVPTPENLAASVRNPAGGAAANKLVKEVEKEVKLAKAIAAEFEKTKLTTDDLGKGMNKSFQGMQSQASIVQKIIGGTMDFFAIGVSKTQKEFVGALKKMFSEGDIAGGIDALINMKYQFVDLKKLAEPFAMVFGPFNQMLGAIAQYATQFIAQSPEFQAFLQNAFSAGTMDTLKYYGQLFADVVLKFVNMDWEKAVNALYKLIEGVGNFIEFIDKWNTFWSPGSGYAENHRVGEGQF